MASQEETASHGDWEEAVVMLELPNGVNLNAARKDLYLQVAGLWSEQPVVKLDDMLYTGKVEEPIGSHLIIECRDEEGTKQAKKKREEEQLILVSDSHIKLEPIYLERKADRSGPPILKDASKKEGNT